MRTESRFPQNPHKILWRIAFHPYYRQNQVPPAGFEQLLQHTGLTHICEQGGTESGTVVEDSRLVQMLQSISSLTDDERDLLAELLQKMGSNLMRCVH